jgi:hypothetical protein
MCRTLFVAAATAAVLSFSPIAFAQHANQSGSPEEAKAMLTRAATAVKADKDRALVMFNTGDGGFLDRDLYPFCFNVGDGKTIALANPHAKHLIGQDIRNQKDAAGKPYGVEVFAASQKPEGQITEVEYLFARPTDPRPVQKVSFITRTGDLVCGVGYYK